MSSRYVQQTKEHCWEKSRMTQTHGDTHHDHLEDSIVSR